MYNKASKYLPQSKHLKIYSLSISFIAIWSFLFVFGRYNLYIQEQEQLFQFNFFYISTVLKSAGGLSLLITEFVIQFCHIPLLGTMLIASVIMLAYRLFHRLLKQLSNGSWSYIFAIMPLCPLLFSLVVNESMYPLVALTITLATTLVLTKIKSASLLRISASIISLPLYWAVGPTAILMLLALPLVRLFDKKEPTTLYNFIFDFIPLLFYLVVGTIFIRFNIIASLQLFLSPNHYVRLYRTIDGTILISWIVVLSVIIVAYFVNKLFTNSRLFQHIIACILAAGLIFSLYAFKNDDIYGRIYQWQKLHYLYSSERYNDILEIYEDRSPSGYFERNYINLALLETDRFSSDYFKYEPLGYNSIVSEWTNSPFPVPYIWTQLWTKVGLFSLAQRSAFEGNMMVGARGGAMYMQPLAEIYIRRGDYEIAKRYINQLKAAPFYRKWAKEMEYFVSDEYILSEEAANNLEKFYYKEEALLATKQLNHLLMEIILNDPSQTKAIEVLGIIALSDGAIVDFRNSILTLIDNSLITEMPPIFQEAILMCFPMDTTFWEKVNIPEEMQSRYSKFVSLLNQSGANSIKSYPPMNEFIGTYWYYYVSMAQGSYLATTN